MSHSQLLVLMAYGIDIIITLAEIGNRGTKMWANSGGFPESGDSKASQIPAQGEPRHHVQSPSASPEQNH